MHTIPVIRHERFGSIDAPGLLRFQQLARSGMPYTPGTFFARPLPYEVVIHHTTRHPVTTELPAGTLQTRWHNFGNGFIKTTGLLWTRRQNDDPEQWSRQCARTSKAPLSWLQQRRLAQQLNRRYLAIKRALLFAERVRHPDFQSFLKTAVAWADAADATGASFPKFPAVIGAVLQTCGLLCWQYGETTRAAHCFQRAARWYENALSTDWAVHWPLDVHALLECIQCRGDLDLERGDVNGAVAQYGAYLARFHALKADIDEIPAQADDLDFGMIDETPLSARMRHYRYMILYDANQVELQARHLRNNKAPNTGPVGE